MITINIINFLKFHIVNIFLVLAIGKCFDYFPSFQIFESILLILVNLSCDIQFQVPTYLSFERLHKLFYVTHNNACV